MKSYPFFSACGTHRELGRQHGEQCRAQILGFLDYLSRTLQLPRDELRARALRFESLFRRYCPHLVEEVEGLAESVRVPFADALAVQIRGEMAQGEGCTTFVIGPRGTKDGQILIGQNSDVEPEHEEFAYVLRLEPEDRPRVLMWTFGGMIGYHGLNSKGVAHFANSLGGGPAWRFGLPHYPIKRMMLEQESLAGVFDLLRRVPVCSSGNYVLCEAPLPLSHAEARGSKNAIADVELTPEGFSWLEDNGAGFLGHANHFLHAPHACPRNDAASLPDSFPRQGRIQVLVKERFGQLTVADMKSILADHDGHPTSICRHPHAGPDHASVSARGRTTASLIAEPARGLLHVSRGNPCENEYATYRLETWATKG